LDKYLELRKEAERRDHRKLGKELDLFSFSDNVGPGLPLWHPKGAVLIEELEKLAKEEEFKAGYVRVRTPHITKGKLYELSGHLDHYKASMFPPMKLDGEKEEYYLKPMNCPHHHMIFSASPKSYRDLPLRYAEYGTCYRFEDSGALFGLMRVRSMQMNDAHMYCTEDQFEQEFIGVTEMYLRYFKLFGIEKYVMRLSVHDPKELGKKYINEPELWKHTEEMVRRAMKKAKVNTVEVPNEAAFYGPKIDIEVFSSIGREFTLATNQVDFAQPGRFGLTYMSKDGVEETPLCIHRAPLSTHERMVGFLLEHYAGNFPAWLSPEHVRVIPITDPQNDYAGQIVNQLLQVGIRASADTSAQRMNAKIRAAQLMKVPYMLVVGENEAAAGQVSLRVRDGSRADNIPLAEFIARAHGSISTRSGQL